MPWEENPDVVSVVVRFNSRNYRRYPESPHRHLREYYSRSGGRRFLHQDVWESHYGAIPEGHHIHHKDHNSQNNDPENLACIPASEHWDEHLEQRREHGSSSGNLEHLAQCREKAAEWHRSDEGRDWHRAVSAGFLDGAREKLREAREWRRNNPQDVVCTECGETFKSASGRATICSTACACRKSRRKRRVLSSI